MCWESNEQVTGERALAPSDKCSEPLSRSSKRTFHWLRTVIYSRILELFISLSNHLAFARSSNSMIATAAALEISSMIYLYFFLSFSLPTSLFSLDGEKQNKLQFCFCEAQKKITAKKRVKLGANWILLKLLDLININTAHSSSAAAAAARSRSIYKLQQKINFLFLKQQQRRKKQ